MTGNRPVDVCALCDRPIDLTIPAGNASLHRYLGSGWVHGGGREYIPVHWGCAVAKNQQGDDVTTFIGGKPVNSILEELRPLRPLHRCRALDEAYDLAWVKAKEQHRDDYLALAEEMVAWRALLLGL